MFDGFDEAQVDVGDGVQLRVRHGGAGAPMLLLHGHPRTHTTWHEVAPLLVAAGHAMVCPDQFDGYRDVPGVASRSRTDTFIAAKLWIDNPRWRGAPFLLRTGKRMAATEQRVSVVLRTPDGPIKRLPVDANVLSFSLSGAGEIDLSLVAKKTRCGA